MRAPATSQLVRSRRGSPARPDDWMVAQLPIGMQEDDFLVRFVRIFQDLASGLMVHADGLGHMADLTVAPAPMVRWLGHWIGIDSIDPRMDDVLQRAMVHVIGRSLQWRGTRQGLLELLELLTEPGTVIEIDDSGGIFLEGEAPPAIGEVTVLVGESSPYFGDTDFAAMIRAAVPATVNLMVLIAGEIVFTDIPEAPTR